LTRRCGLIVTGADATDAPITAINALLCGDQSGRRRVHQVHHRTRHQRLRRHATVTAATDTRADAAGSQLHSLIRASGRTQVNRLSGPTVRSGGQDLSGNESDSQVTSGVQEGDVIIVGGASGWA
jgi:hypothetical protein